MAAKSGMSTTGANPCWRSTIQRFITMDYQVSQKLTSGMADLVRWYRWSSVSMNDRQMCEQTVARRIQAESLAAGTGIVGKVLKRFYSYSLGFIRPDGFRGTQVHFVRWAIGRQFIAGLISDRFGDYQFKTCTLMIFFIGAVDSLCFLYCSRSCDFSTIYLNFNYVIFLINVYGK